jgi:hypothetical protein
MPETNIDKICDTLDEIATGRFEPTDEEVPLLMDAISIIRDWHSTNEGKDINAPSPYLPFRVVCLSDGKWSVKCDADRLQGYILTRECRYSYDSRFLAEVFHEDRWSMNPTISTDKYDLYTGVF